MQVAFKIKLSGKKNEFIRNHSKPFISMTEYLLIISILLEQLRSAKRSPNLEYLK